MSDKTPMPPQIQAIHKLFNRHIRYYPVLTAVFGGNQNCAIVFAEFLYQDGLRLTRKAEFFTLTDPQLSERCGIGVDQVKRAREYICDPGVLLFKRERHGSPPINHYQGQYDRIYGWLEVNGIGRPVVEEQTSKCGETQQLNVGKPNIQTLGNPLSFNNLLNMNDGDVDARVRARAVAIDQFLISISIENPTRTELVNGLRLFEDGLETAKDIAERTFVQLEASERGSKWMRSGAGMIVSRIRDAIKAQTQTETKPK